MEIRQRPATAPKATAKKTLGQPPSRCPDKTQKTPITPARSSAKPNVRQFDSYREYLRAYYEYRKHSRPGFSFRKFSESANIKSPNFLQLVMLGKRNMSEETGAQVARAMGLLGAERSYFLALIKQENAKHPEQLAEANRGLLKAVKHLVSRNLASSQAQFISNWHHAAVKELAALPAFQAEGDWISKKLRGLISPRQAEESLALLRDLGLLNTDENNPQKKVLDNIDTGKDNFDFARVLRNHLQTLDVWKTVLPSLSQDERELGLIVFPISSRRVEEFKERIRQFQEETIAWLEDDEAPDKVMQLGTYLIPISN